MRITKLKPLILTKAGARGKSERDEVNSVISSARLGFRPKLGYDEMMKYNPPPVFWQILLYFTSMANIKINNMLWIDS